MTQDLPLRGSLGAPGQVNPKTQLQGDQKTPVFPTRGTEFTPQSQTAAGVLGGPLYNLDPSKFDFFLKADADNEELRALDQGHGEQIIHGLGRFIATTLTKTVEGIGFLGAIPGAIAGGDMNRIVDNAWSDWWSHAEDSVKEAMPIYHANKYNNGNILKQASTLDFWMDDVVDGLAFFASAFLGSKGINALTKGAKGLSSTAKLFTKATTAARTGAAPIGGQLLKAGAIASEADLFTMSVGNSFVEGMFEAKDAKDKLIQQGLSNEEASKAAMGTFWWNMAALMPSNYITNSFLFKKPLVKGGRIIESVDETSGKVALRTKPLTFKDKALAFGKAASLSAASEGPYEENIQLAIQNYFADKAVGKEKEGQLLGIASRMFDNFSTDEGQKSIFLGAVIGLIPGGIGGVHELQAEHANESKLALLMNTTLESVRNDPSMKDVWLKTTDPKTKKETYVFDQNGKPVPDVLKLAKYFQALYGTTRNVTGAFIATETGNETMFDRLREQVNASLAYSMLYHPDGQVQFNSEIEKMARIEVERATKEGEEVDEAEVNKRAAEYKGKWASYKSIYDNITNNYAGLFDLGKSNLSEVLKNEAVKSQFMGAIDQMFWSKQKQILQAKKAKAQSSDYADLDIAQGEIDNIDEQLAFIDKFTKSLRSGYKTLLKESYWQKKHDALVELARAQEEAAKTAGARPAEPVKEPAVDLTGKPAEPAKTQQQILDELDAELKEKETKKQTAKDKIVEEISKPKTVEEKAKAVSRIYGDAALEKSTVATAFTDIELFPDKSITAFYNGALGTIFIDRFTPTAAVDTEVRRLVFKNEETGKETVITTTNALNDFTLQQLGIVPLKHTLFDIQVLDELDKISIQGREFGLITDNPLSSIEVNEEGLPVAVELLDNRGETVRFTNPTLVAELAYTVELLEYVKDIVAEQAFQEKGMKSDFAVVAVPRRLLIKGKYKQSIVRYQLYRDTDGKIDVLRIFETAGQYKTVKLGFTRVNKETREKVIRAYYEDITNAIKAAYAEVAQSTFRENQEENIELKERQTNAIKRAIVNSRSASAKEIIESPAHSEIHTVKTEPAEKETKTPSTEVQTPKTDSGKPTGLADIQSLLDKEKLPLSRQTETGNSVVEERDKSRLFAKINNIINKGLASGRTTEEIYIDIRENKLFFGDSTTNEVKKVQDYIDSLRNKPARINEAEIVEEVTNKVAEEEAARPDPAEAVSLSTIGIEAIDKGVDEVVTSEEYYPKRGLKHTYSAIAYKAEDNVEFDKFVSEQTNTLGGYYLMAEIDYMDPYWEQHDNNPEAIKATIDKIVKGKNNVDNFDSLVDTIPIKLVMYDASGNKTGFVNLALHRSDYTNIVVPQEIRDILDPTQRKKAYDQLKKDEMLKTRNVRNRVIKQLLSGKKVVFANLEKGIGVFQNGDNSKVSEIFTDTVNIKIGIADSTGTIYAGGGEMLVGKGNPGNVFLETKETCNGKPFNVKLNPVKITTRQADILYEAYRIAANSEGGLFTIFHSPEVEGGLTVKEVIDYLVLEGPITDQENTKYNPEYKPHLVSKQLWLDNKTGILTYGESKLNLRKKTLTEEDKKKFIDHVTTNKNHVISINGDLSLGMPIKRDFRIGDVDGKRGESYEQFLIKNSYIVTDIIKDPTTGKPFSKPVISYDASEFESEEPPKPRIIKAAEAKEEALITPKPVETGKKTVKLNSKEGRMGIGLGSVISTSLVGEEGFSGGTEIATIIEKDGQAVLKVTATDQEIIEDMAPVEGLPFSDPKFISKVQATIPYAPLVVTIEAAAEPVVEQEKPFNKQALIDSLNERAEKYGLIKQGTTRGEDILDIIGNGEKDFAKEIAAIPKEVWSQMLIDALDARLGKKVIRPVVDTTIAGEFTRKVEDKITKYRVGNITKAHNYLKNKFGKNTKIEVVEGFVKVATNLGTMDAFGLFIKDGFVLSEMLEIGTEFHEAFHRVSTTLMSPKQRESIYKEARVRYKLKEGTDLEIEEKLAEEFREYVLTDGLSPKFMRSGSKIKQFFQDLWDFIKTFFTGDLHITDLDVNNLFRIINKSSGSTGRLTYAKPNKASLAWLEGRAFNKLVKGVEFKTIKNTEQLDNIVKNIVYLAFKQGEIFTTKDLKKLDLLSPLPVLQGKINYTKAKAEELKGSDLGEAYSQLSEMFQEIVDNYDTLLGIVKDQLYVLGVTTVLDEQGEVEEKEDPEDESDLRGDNLQRYGRASFEVNNKDNAAANIKLMIATLRETEELDEYTSLHKFVDFDQAWDTFQHELQDKTSIEEMEASLKDKADASTMHKDLLGRLRDPRRKDKFDTLRTQFFSTMKKNRNNMVNVSVNKKTGDHAIFTVGNAETQRISLTYTTAWGQAFASSSVFDKGKPDKAFLRDVINNYKRILKLAETNYDANTATMKDIEAVKEEVIKLFNSVSIPMDSLTLDNVLNNKIAGATVDESLLNFLKHRDYKVSFLFGERGPFHSLITTGKIFSRGREMKEIPVASIYKNESSLKEIVGNAYVESHGEQRMNSILGPSGHTYYLISDNSFLTDTMNDLNKGENYLSGLSGVTYAKHSLWRQAMTDPKVRENVKAFIMSTFAQEESSDIGRGYDELTKLEDYLLKVSLLESGYISLPQLADRQYLYAMKGLPTVKFNYLYDEKTNTLRIPDSVVQIFADYIKDEKARIDQVKEEVVHAIDKGNTDSLVKDYHYKDVPTDRKGAGEKFQHFPSFNGRKFDTIDIKSEITKMLNERIEETIKEFTRLGIIASSVSKSGISTGIRNRLLDENMVKEAITKTKENNEGFAVKNIIARFVVNSMVSTIESEKIFFGDPAYYGTVDNKAKRASVITSTGTNLRLEFEPDILPGDRLIHGSTFNSILLKTQKYSSGEIYEELVKKYVALGQDEKKVRAQLKGYLDVDQTDAQAYITPQMRRALKVKMGEWSEQENRAYELIMSGRKLTAKEQKIVDDLYMEPMKFSYFGFSFSPGNGRPVMYKTSMATLTPQLVAGTQLEELYDRMQAKDDPSDIAIYDTGVKVGAMSAVEFFEKDKDGNRIEDAVNVADISASDTYKLSFKNLRRQQITEPHMEQYGKLHTQFKKIIMSNIVNSNEYTVDKDKINGDALKQENTSLISELSNRGKTEFMSLLGWEEGAETITDRKKEQDFVTKRARKANMPETFIEALSSQVEGDYMEYDALPDRKWIHTTLISQLGKHTIDIRVPGTALIQMSNFGLRKAKKDDSLKLYDKDGYMEAKVSVEIFRNSIPGYNDMTDEERMTMANNLFVGIGYRIPTQGLSSTVPLKIVGFLPSTSTSSIALPAEFTKLTGSDFDIDKLYFIRHNYDKEGKKIEFVKGLALKEQSREALENRLIDIYFGVLLSNHHLIDTKTPLDASTLALKDQAKLIETLEGVNKERGDLYVASPMFQAEIKEKYLGGKSGVAPFALNNAHHVLGQMVGLGLNYSIGTGNVVDGKTSLSGINGQDDIPILNWLSALVNAHVDIAKDPYIFSLNVNEATYNATSLLIRSGVGGELTFAFLAQPVLKEYAEFSKLTKGRIRSTNRKAGNAIKTKYKNLLDRALVEQKLKAADVTPSDNIFNIERLNKDIAQKKGAAYYARQLQVLEKFMNINETAYALSNAVRASQIDTKRYGNNLMEIKAHENLVKRVLSEGIIVGMDRMFEETFLRTAYENSIQLAFKLFSNNILMGTNVFSDLHDRILKEMGYELDTSRNASRRINLVADELFGAIAGRFFVNNLGNDTSKVKGMFFGENTISKRVLDLKHNPKYKSNPFVRLLNPTISENESDPDLLTLFNATENRTKWHKDRIIEGWTDLLADTSTELLAKDLVAYSFFTSGFRKSLHSFYQYIPPQYLKDIGYVEYIKNTREAFKDGSTADVVSQEIYHDVYKNLWHNSEAVPYLTMSEVSHRRPFKGEREGYYKMLQVPSVTESSKEKMLIGENMVGDPVFRPYFKINIHDEVYLYKYIGYRYSTKTKQYVGVYAVESKKGFFAPAGKIIKEYGLSTSIFDKNNVRQSVEADDLKVLDRIYNEDAKTKKLLYDYSGFVHVPSDMAVIVKEFDRNNLEEDTEGAVPEEATVMFPLEITEADPSTFTDHSGGAYGSDTEWDIIGREFGLLNFKHYYKGTKTPLGNVEITNEELEEGWKHVLEANKTLNRKPEGYKNLLSRNWFQVKNATAIFAIGSFADNLKSSVKGGTGWAVQMAKDANKTVFVFNLEDSKWYMSKRGSNFKETHTPTLTKDFAGIGTRGIKQPNGTYVLQEAAKQAIRNVYKNTFGKKDKSPLTDISPNAIKDNEQDFLHCNVK